MTERTTRREFLEAAVVAGVSMPLSSALLHTAADPSERSTTRPIMKQLFIVSVSLSLYPAL
jgi:hypothetical protein